MSGLRGDWVLWNFLSQKCNALAIYVKNGPGWENWHLFHEKWWGIALLSQKCHKTQSCSSLDPELQYCKKVFENSSVGLRIRAFTAAFGAKIGQNMGNGAKMCGTSLERGDFLFDTKIFTCIRCRIWCRLWFCHQTWLEFIIWLTYGCSKLRRQWWWGGSVVVA